MLRKKQIKKAKEAKFYIKFNIDEVLLLQIALKERYNFCRKIIASDYTAARFHLAEAEKVKALYERLQIPVNEYLYNKAKSPA